MKALLIGLGVSALIALGGPPARVYPCRYVVETPTSGEAYYTLEDARAAYDALGLGPDGAEGYDIVSATPSC